MMQFSQIPRKFIIIVAIVALFGGASLLIRSLVTLLPQPGLSQPAPVAHQDTSNQRNTPVTGTLQSRQSYPITKDLPTEAVEPSAPLRLTLTITDGIPAHLLASISAVAQQNPTSQIEIITTTSSTAPDNAIRLDWQAEKGHAIYTQTFAAALRFDTIDTQISWEEVQNAWHGESQRFVGIALLDENLPALQQILGPAGNTIQKHATVTEVVEVAWNDRNLLVLLPFDQLVPRLVVLAIDGQNPVENAAHFKPSAYPLRAIVYAHLNAEGEAALALRRLQAQLPQNNRADQKLTVLIATGTTALTRMLAGQMDEHGVTWPASMVADELASADITIVSNEVAFTPDCETIAEFDLIVFCSKPDYFQTLQAVGVDLVSLTGNHINDYGTKALQWTLDLYDQKKIAYYGGGKNAEEAAAPLILTHHGNRLIFLGANTVGPEIAWATDKRPGAATFDFEKIAKVLADLRDKNPNAIILFDVQYLESYGVSPRQDQRETFNFLLQSGADIVTGVQSHVPQAMEFTDGKLILFGLGNIFFDQMDLDATRQGIVAKHTFYAGRHLSTQLRTTMIYEYGQPHWTTPEQHQEILERVFIASYW